MQKQIHISIRIIDGLAKIIFWLFSIVSLIFTGLIIMYVLGVPFGEFPGHIELPIQFDVIEKGKLIMQNSSVEVQITDASGKIGLGNMPKIFSIIFLIGFLILTGGVIAALQLFIKFISNVKKGQVFMVENIKYLKRISFISLGLWIFLQVSTLLFNLLIVNKFAFTTINFKITNGSFGVFLWLALILWVLSHLFEKGAEIEEENSLTI